MRRSLIAFLSVLLIPSGFAVAGEGENRVRIVLEQGDKIVEKEFEISGDVELEMPEFEIKPEELRKIHRYLGALGGEETQRRMFEALSRHLPKEMVHDIVKAMKAGAPVDAPAKKGSGCPCCDAHRMAKGGKIIGGHAPYHERPAGGSRDRTAPGAPPHHEFFGFVPEGPHEGRAAGKAPPLGHADGLVQAINALRHEIGALRKEIQGVRAMHARPGAGAAMPKPAPPSAGKVAVKVEPAPREAMTIAGGRREVRVARAATDADTRKVFVVESDGVVHKITAVEPPMVVAPKVVAPKVVAPGTRYEARSVRKPASATPSSSEIDEIRKEMRNMKAQMKEIMQRLVELSERDR